ncbi:MAG: hypothetical protein E6H79_20725, partial [Betaproteobacteria bacterium]
MNALLKEALIDDRERRRRWPEPVSRKLGDPCLILHACDGVTAAAAQSLPMTTADELIDLVKAFAPSDGL